MKPLFSVCLLLLAITHSNSQNLVKNSSFEDYKICPEDIGKFKDNVTNWSILQGTTDYLNSCSRTVGFLNHNGKQIARSGFAYAGIFTYSNKDYREYIQGTLEEPLEKDKKYIVTFYVSLADYATLAIEDFSILFTNKPVAGSAVQSSNKTLVTRKTLSKINDLIYDHYQQIDPILYKSKQIWMQVYIPFTAKGYETHFTIGNFASNTRTQTLKVSDSNEKDFSYYYIDDVSVEVKDRELPPLYEETVPQITDATPKIERNKIYTFKNVLFEFNKADLLSASEEEINVLATILRNNKKLFIEIYGHTDAVGSQERNLELSNERAKSVATYLIEKGIDKDRVKWLGYGSSKPIADNATEEGRTQNRRVEFKVLEN
ncbi:OmpA family protein [Cellulophaga fucicola]|uniref:Outer membrane protein OmpA n=1 Tax=Cellulophaga fucicola TaxID=76595 RepID=A0A1K1Q562_9FLAO|nr:OmpA family protein [Cellulophaga fucicola]SFW54270.1 Outer membrane protein OmpA [Cellulophaga fucicola]